MTKSKCVPDSSIKPLAISIDHQMKASAGDIYKAWTERFDWWFAQPGELMMAPEIDKPYFFYNRHDWGRHPHYGRFLELEKDKLVVMTWLTGIPGTYGSETVIRLELTPNKDGTQMRFTHSGFHDEASRDGHKENWPGAFDVLDEVLASQKQQVR